MSTLLRRYSQYLPWFFLGVLAFTGLYLVSLQSYLLFHCLIEIFSIVIAFSIFIITWNTRRLHENDFFLFLGIAYFFIGSLDLLHALSYKGMGVFPNHDANLPTQVWISARYLESITLLLAPLFFCNKPVFPCVIGIYTLLVSVLLGTLFYWHTFPDCFVEGSGLTQFKIRSEYLICLLLLLATAHLLSHRQNVSPNTLQLLVCALFFTILAELSFTLYFSVYGYANMVGHYCKLLSFYCLYKALVCSGLKNPIELLFRNLEEKAELYQNLYDNAPLPYQSLDEKGYFKEVNATWLDTMGYTREEVVGRSFGDFFEVGWQDHFKEKFSSFKNTGEVLGVEFELRRKDGSFIPVRLSGKISYDTQGNFKHTNCLFQDISQQRVAEKELLQTMKELQDTNAELTQFNYAVAHDLKAPIRALSNYAAFLQKDLAQVVSGESKKYLSRLKQTAVETGRMVEDLLLLAKISNQVEELVEIEVGDFMKRLVSAMDPSPDIEISTDSDWPTIMTDPILLRQIFQNLIDNAVKYTPAPPKRIEIGCLPGEDEGLTIFVRDNGIGIGAAYHKQIFGLFERLHSPKEYGGTGVGLAIVHKAVNRLGGTIRLDSTEGKGTTFYVTLPVEPAVMR